MSVNESFVTPFQGWKRHSSQYPGRCPGLLCFGLSGQESAGPTFYKRIWQLVVTILPGQLDTFDGEEPTLEVETTGETAE